MGVPAVSVKKQDFATGVARPSNVGVLAILASAAGGTLNQPAGFASDAAAVTAFTAGVLPELASYCLQIGGNPVLLQRIGASISGNYGQVATSGTGTATATTDGSLFPFDEYNFVLLTFQQGGTVGVTGMTYRLSFDGGLTDGGLQALGTATSIADTVKGVKVNLSGGTIANGQTFAFYTSRPMPNAADVATALTALAKTRIPWEGVLVDSESGTASAPDLVGQLDTWLAGLEAVGSFHFALVNTRHKNLPNTPPGPGINPFLVATNPGETEAAYVTAMQTLTQNDASIRVCVGADAADYVSSLTGITQPRPVAMFLAARAMLIPIGEDPAYVGRGNVVVASIADANGNPKWHDEDLSPGLDALRLVTLRSFAPGGPQGVYITNANVISPSGSDYVWLQHVRLANAASSIAWGILVGQLSIGVGKKAPDPVTGGIYIAEHDAQRIEGLVNNAFVTPFKNQVVAIDFVLSRTDDLSSTASSLVHGDIEIEALAYLKNFQVQTSFVKTIAIPTSTGQAPQQESP